MIGGATALEIALLAAGIATVFGVFFGAVSGYAGGVIDAIMMRIVDTVLSIPVLFLLIVIAAILKPVVLADRVHRGARRLAGARAPHPR